MKAMPEIQGIPDLILVSGPPGAGKSTFSDALARKLSAAVFDKDCIDEPFSPDDRGDQYTATIEPKVLFALLALAERNLTLGLSVILDVPWTHLFLNSPQWMDAVKEVSRRTGARLFVFELELPEGDLRMRLKKRGLKRDLERLTDSGWAKFRISDRLGEANPLPHHRFDAKRPVDQNVEKALNVLKLGAQSP